MATNTPETRRQRIATDWRLLVRALRHRNYSLFFAGQGVSLIGTWMTRVATAWLVYRLTGSAMLLGWSVSRARSRSCFSGRLRECGWTG
jgi:hypothetical protein